MSDDGEQGPDTDGLAKYLVECMQRDAAWVRAAVQNAHLVSDGHEAAAIDQLCGIRDANTELMARIARKEAANEALVAKLEATMADMRSLQRQNENWQAECQRLSALLVEMQHELARRMAMPANALRHGGVR